jgi:O-antigen ligase
MFFILLPTVTLGYTIMLTQSRGAIIGVGALGLLTLQRLFGTVVTAATAALGLAGVVGLTFGGGRAFSTEEQSAAQRIDAWWEGINLLKSYPLFGAGYGNFTKHHYLTAHNSFVLCFAELGLFGFFAWLGLIVLTYKGLAQAIRLSAGPGAKPYLHAAEILRFALVGYLVCAWFLSRTYQPITFVLLGLCISAWYCAYSNASPGSDPASTEPKTLVPWKASTALAMFSTIFGVYIFLWISG